MDLAKYRRLFLEESREHLGVLNRELLRLEREGGAVDGLFRAAHSVKGMAGSMGYDAIVEIAHALEDVLDAVRRETLAATPALLQLLFEGVDALGSLVAEVEDHGAPRRNLAGVAARLREAAGAALRAGGPQAAGVGAPEAGAGDAAASGSGTLHLAPEQLARVVELCAGGSVPYACRVRVSRDAAAVAARNVAILGCLARCGTVVCSSPTAEEARTGNGREVVEALLLTRLPEARVRARLHAVPELGELRVTRLRLGDIEAGECPLGAAAGGGSQDASAARRIAPEAAGERREEPVAGLAARHAPKRSPTLRVDTSVLDELTDIVGELIITRERLERIGSRLGSRELDEALGALRPLVRGFQDAVMAVRLMPLELITDRLPRLVRDIARSLGKEVGFETEGGGIAMDRAVLEELNDVLIHLVRNAVDHGVETPDERAAAGKGRKAVIRLRTGRERDWFWVTVEDDGRGMDPEGIAAAAVGRGLATAAAVAAMGEGEKLLLCCLSGVSTAGSVSDISGRGVGMDVVKARVDACGGSLRIDSRPGCGTAITLRLPLTLAIVRILLVEVAGRAYGLPVSHVVRAGVLDREMVAWSGGRPLLRHGDDLVPLHDLGVLLGGPPRDMGAAPGLFVAVSEFSERGAGLAVDRLLGIREVVVKPLGPPLDRVRGLAGATVVGDGTTVLLLDPAALVCRP
jgi:two-component system chemotaxis sensor kinase CheA